jgi:glycerol-3-phosphate dehydrogenase
MELESCRPELAGPLCPHTRETVAQAAHAVRQEGALTVADVLLRRTPAGWSPCLGLDAAPVVARLLAEELSWTAADERAAIGAYSAEVERTFRRLKSSGK